jgi:hypothetical protein
MLRRVVPGSLALEYEGAVAGPAPAPLATGAGHLTLRGWLLTDLLTTTLGRRKRTWTVLDVLDIATDL